MDDPLSLNLYTYVHNEPISFFDPTGHWAVGDERAATVDGKVLNNLSYSEGRGLEQLVFEENTKVYGKLLNKIRPVNNATAKGAEKAAIYAMKAAKFLGRNL